MVWRAGDERGGLEGYSGVMRVGFEKSWSGRVGEELCGILITGWIRFDKYVICDVQ